MRYKNIIFMLILLVVMSGCVGSNNALSIEQQKSYDEGMSAYDSQNYEKAFKIFRKACDDGIAGMCNNLGFMYDNAQGTTKDNFKAVEAYKEACDGKIAIGCYNLGNMYRESKGTRLDYFKAFEAYDEACKLGFAVGCFNLGGMYHTGQGVRQDDNKAKEAYGKACDLRYQRGCDIFKDLNENSQ